MYTYAIHCAGVRNTLRIATQYIAYAKNVQTRMDKGLQPFCLGQALYVPIESFLKIPIFRKGGRDILDHNRPLRGTPAGSQCGQGLPALWPRPPRFACLPSASLFENSLTPEYRRSGLIALALSVAHNRCRSVWTTPAVFKTFHFCQTGLFLSETSE